jgi:Carboxypeptidase regulatory-like domain
MHRVKRKILYLLVAILVVSCAVHAEVTGKITGVVTDQSSSVVMGATVVVTNTATGIKQTIKTEENGVFTFPVLPVGRYRIDVRWFGVQVAYCRKFSWATWATKAAKIEVEESRLTD